MAKEPKLDLEFDDESDEQDVAEQLDPKSVAAVVTGTDWTTETVVSQLQRGNIQLDPRFQRRDAWKNDRKSRFIESLIVGLPIPQIVLAETKGDRGRFMVLDGKQRLLSILQFWGLGEGENNSYPLSGLTLRADLIGKSFAELSVKTRYDADFKRSMFLLYSVLLESQQQRLERRSCLTSTVLDQLAARTPISPQKPSNRCWIPRPNITIYRRSYRTWLDWTVG